jgi:hypothetical protein
MEHWCNDTSRRVIVCTEKHVPVPICPTTTNPPWNFLGLNLGPSDERLDTNQLSHGMVLTNRSCRILSRNNGT